ncbi:MAG: serine hydrolase domain-containing protein [Granulosicoccus sp.]
MPRHQLESLISQFGLTDLAIAINRDNTAVFSAGYGHCDPACTQAISPDTLFGVASITKLITSISILQLQDGGQLSLDDSVSHYFPTLMAASNPNLKVHHLLSHTSGWPGLASRYSAVNLSAPYDMSGGITGIYSTDQGNATKLYSLNDLVNFMNSQRFKLLAEPGRLMSYSNEGFCLLGGIIEQLTGDSWQHNVEQHVFKPLGMLNSTTGIPDSSLFTSIAQPITISNKQRTTYGIWDAPLFYPTGGAVASVRDLLKLMTVLSPDGPLLKSKSRAQLLAPSQAIASRPGKCFGYSLGLEYRKFNSNTIMHWHTGQRAGLSALVAAFPEKGLSMALLSNSSDAPLTAIAHQLITLFVSDCAPRWPPTADQSESHPTMRNLCGHYGSDEGFSYFITRHDEEYYISVGSETSRQLLQFRTPTSGYVGQQTFAFLTTHITDPANSEPWALAIDLRVLPRIE